jgi:protocatechuate 3,4-dioxygenase beta subunit
MRISGKHKFIAWMLAAPVSLLSPPATAGQAARQKPETCRVSGMVLQARDGTPLKNATVRLENGEDHEHVIAARTSADGRFALKNVPPGRYKVIASRSGYVEAEYGQRKPADPGAVLTLAAGQSKTEIAFRLVPAAVISGRVFDEEGEPAANANVVLSREMYQEGRKTFGEISTRNTDDLGAYRLFGLAPGRYVVCAAEQLWGNNGGEREFNESPQQAGSERGYARTCYPQTQEIARAAAIQVKEADEVRGIDIYLKQVPVRRIRGKAVNVMSQALVNELQVLLFTRDQQNDGNFAGEIQVKKSDGSFEMTDVVPGQYILIAYWWDAAEKRPYFGSQKIDVGESDVEGVTLVVGPGSTVSGRIVWDGRPSLEQNELYVTASPEDAGSLLNSGRGRVDGNQRFTLKDLMEGGARVGIMGASKDCYVKQIEFGQSNLKNDVIDVSKSGNPPLEITISSHGAKVEGAVSDEVGLPAAGVWVVAVPEAARRSLLRLFKSQTTDQYGKFELRGLAPGEYKLFAWDGVESSAWQDEEFLKEYEARGSKFEVRDDQTASVNPKLIAAKKKDHD